MIATPAGTGAASADPRAARRREILLWLTAGLLACLLALYQLSDTLSGGVYVPGDPDSLYHGHRILDSIDAPTQMYQFDPRIHAPEGSWITWPWAYDMGMAWIAHIARNVFGVRDPMSVLAYVAPLWTFLNAGLLARIAIELGLSFAARAVVMLCFAVSPMTQVLHRAGMLDHHFVEYSCVLATLLCGLRWFQQIENRRRAIVLGIVLGAAPAFHNGLFIVQLPVLLTLGVRWLLGRSGPARSISAFAAALFASTLLFLLPSEPFRRLMFSFSLQSWFHLFIATSTGLLACELATVRRSWRGSALIGATAAALLAVIWAQVAVGGDFLSGHLVDLSQMAEVRGPIWYLSHLHTDAITVLNQQYGGLIWLLPVGLIAMALQLNQRSDDAKLFFAVMVIFGVALLSQQQRLENYGSFSLYLPLACLADRLREKWPAKAVLIPGLWGATAAAAYVPAYPSLVEPLPLGSSQDYETSLHVLQKLRDACATQPGIVLASSDDGHPITFHTRCSVISDDFIITAQHEQKLLETERLMHSSVDEVLQSAPYVRYIFVRCQIVFSAYANGSVTGTTCVPHDPDNQGLREQLLIDGPPFPPRLKLIGEVSAAVSGSKGPPTIFARAFEVLPASAVDSTQ